ncbi:hypothetical protein C8D92_110114 [Tamilnaduibacter salinus]|uniref:Probable inorganic carbon transporter subunit DabA n=1 Tax=Tamilnaduibacter salinus TaxID=1484056 RepID=A0A2U1CTP3_9GAMM|nr:DUF2309 domain-containing protein [Tamilnaduibacter salinus]PVY70083.1 hypothetical protein C8D92_110114 [Tamilnaduibacter salinus]
MSVPSLKAITEAKADTPDWQAAVTDACERIAPSWPLDQMIAVNPFWEMRDWPFTSVASRMAALNGTCCQNQAALEGQGNGSPAATETASMPEHWQNLSAQLDRNRDTAHHVGWQDEVVHQISQFCGDYFQRLDAGDFKADAQDLYHSWLQMTRADRGIAIVMEEPSLPSQFQVLPDQHEKLIVDAFNALAPRPDYASDYAHALLLDINGWSSWAAYLRWQARLHGSGESSEEDLLPGLLAIRLAWELAIWRHVQHVGGAIFAELKQRWLEQWDAWPEMLKTHEQSQTIGWRQHTEAEAAYQSRLAEKLLSKPEHPLSDDQPLKLQAAFCIDVRSEVFRRALEAQNPAIQTLGFAGFFGLPISYRPKGTGFCRPQLPGLLAPALEVTESEPAVSFSRQSLVNHSHWSQFSNAGPASFSFIESMGLAGLGRMVRKTFLGESSDNPVDQLHKGQTEFEIRQNGNLLGVKEKADLVGGILRAMTLTHQFAPTVLLVGHGSRTRNNPHAAGLDCGACGGQTGSVNVRVLAGILNDKEVREALAEQGISIPPETRFVGALHNTTTDEVDCADGVPEEIRKFLASAGAQARRERAIRLGIASENDVDSAIKKRSQDWSEVRPEWGLAGNASFIVAPRAATRHLDLGGRSFLHDYRWREDEGFSTLELIMTAPMVVTHWINLQYFMSVTDNRHYGSGNKVLHNVVGGHIGVFEGNGGDLRIGLPLQSVHDGERWVHEPLRLSVYIAAPREAIAEIAEKHKVVQELVDNDWLYLFRIDDEQTSVERFYRNDWQTVAVRSGQTGAQSGEA